MYSNILSNKAFFQMNIDELKNVYRLLFIKVERKRKTKRRFQNKKRKTLKYLN